MLGGQLHDLSEYSEWLTTLTDSKMKMLGKNLLLSYGPDTLLTGIRGLDPKHEFMYEKLGKSNTAATKK
jgi:hypothetical protein